MKFADLLRPGIKIKRWLFLAVIGIGSISFGLSFFFRGFELSLIEEMLIFLLILTGIIFIFLSFKYVTKNMIYAIANGRFKISLDSDKIKSLLHEKRILIKGPKIVVIGGGTGLSTMLRGLKAFSSNITAIVTVSDDGGGSGVLRQDLGMLPPGDIRNCVLALADTEPIMEKLLQYRFEDGMLKGQSFGNLFLAAMHGISDSFEEAVRKMSDVLAVTGRVLPVTLQDVKLCAELQDGHIIEGESLIGKHHLNHAGKIKRVYMDPKEIEPLQDAIDAISEADIIVLGPGSLYTSVIPNLLVKKVCSAISSSNAIKVYVCNVMTQPGETEGFSVYDHISAIEKHSYKNIINYCIVNNSEIPEDLKGVYFEDGAETVKIDRELIKKAGIVLIEGDFVSIKNNLIRHDHKKLAEAIIDLVAEELLIKDKRRAIDYYYVKDTLKKIIVG